MNKIKKFYNDHKVEVAVLTIAVIVFVTAELASELTAEKTVQEVFDRKPYIKITEDFFKTAHELKLGE